MQNVVQLFHPSGTLYEHFKAFSKSHPHASWFQSDHFFRFALQCEEATPILLIALQEEKLKDPGAHYLSKQRDFGPSKRHTADTTTFNHNTARKTPADPSARTRQNVSGTGREQPGTISSTPSYEAAGNPTPQTNLSRQPNPVCGSLLAVIIHHQSRWDKTFWPLKQINKPFKTHTLVYGGPLLLDDTRLKQEITTKNLIHALQSLVAGRSLFTRFFNLSDMDEHAAAFRASGFQRTGYRNMIINSTSYESAWKNLSESVRRKVNDSLDNGARIVTKPNREQMDSLWKLLQTEKKKQSGFPVPSKDFFCSLAEKQHTAATLIITHNEKVTGGAVCPILEGNTMHGWYLGGRDDEHRHLNVYPCTLAIWAAIANAADSGTSTVVFMNMCPIEEKINATDPATLFGGKWAEPGSFLSINKKIMAILCRPLC